MTGARLRFALAVTGVAGIHFVASFIAAFAGGIGGGFARVLSHILLFPLSVIEGPTHVALGWGLWGVLSLLWGLGVCLLLRYGLPKA